MRDGEGAGAAAGAFPGRRDVPSPRAASMRGRTSGMVAMRGREEVPTVGVLALQGDFALHGRALDRVNVPWQEVRKPGELDAVAGLIIPGGESTTLLKLMEHWDF